MYRYVHQVRARPTFQHVGTEEVLTVPDLVHDERVEADLVDALVQAVRLVDVQHLAVETLQLAVAQVRLQDLIVELLCRTRQRSRPT